MNATERIEQALHAALAAGTGRECPPRLAAAMRHAVFPAGGRLRPLLCLAVSDACGGGCAAMADAAAASVELLHCASLVHDDLPCFDDAGTRRGRPTVHKAFGEPLAVLAGDGLISLAFETLAFAAPHAPDRVTPLVVNLGRGLGAAGGLVAGQAWECEDAIDLEAYQRAKTGALFVAAMAAGAIAAGAPSDPWRTVGDCIGRAYQVADDLSDAVGSSDALGKPTGRDVALGRPTAIGEYGVQGALRKLADLTSAAMDAVPPCHDRDGIRATLRAATRRLVPKQFALAA